MVFYLIYSSFIFQEHKCKDSIPKIVQTCPQSEANIQKRARMMNCYRYPECLGEKLVYHCVRSKTDLVEVCAPNLRIVCGHKSGTYIIMEFFVTIKTYRRFRNLGKALQLYVLVYDKHSSEAHTQIFNLKII